MAPQVVLPGPPVSGKGTQGRLRARPPGIEYPTCRRTGRAEESAGAGSCPNCGDVATPREDGDLGNFPSRHAEYRRHVLPVIEDCAAHGILLGCMATESIDAVVEHFEDAVRNLIRHGQTT